MTDQQLTDEQQKIVHKVERLLAIANHKKGNEAESAVAAAKAQKLLAAYNIDMAMVEQGSDSSGKREEAKLRGGTYLYQRELWRAVAELNFCMYWTSSRWSWREVKRRTGWMAGLTETVWSLKHQHRVVGRTVNVRSTEVMANYLEQAIERITMERVGGDNTQRFTRWAVSYRKGAAARIIEKIYDRRREMEKEEAARIRAAEAEAARKGVSTSTALTLGDVQKSEREANQDFLFGEGWSAEQAEKRRIRAEAAAEAEAEYTAWAEANPEEARKQEKQREEREEREWQRYRKRQQKADDVDQGAYWSGYDAAEKVGIDPQTGGGKSDVRRLK